MLCTVALLLNTIALFLFLDKRSGSATESRKSLSTAPRKNQTLYFLYRQSLYLNVHIPLHAVSLDKNRRAYAKATHPPDKIVLVQSVPATGTYK